jgi:hypothetical protein
VSLRASALPRIRDQVVRHVTDPAYPLARMLEARHQPIAEAALHLRAAGLYWASADMSALALHSGASLEDTDWSVVARPTHCGLIVFDHGVGQMDFPTVDRSVPVDAVSWGPWQGGCSVSMWADRAKVAQAGRSNGIELIVEQTPPLIPIQMLHMPSGRTVPVGELPAGAGTILATVNAAWYLMQQPLLTDRTSIEVDQDVRRSYRRSGRDQPEVTLIQLRRHYRPDDHEETGVDGAGRVYRHRWVVDGHWRNQPHGPGHGQIKRIWIADHLKGPQGAPLLATTKVNVWRR